MSLSAYKETVQLIIITTSYIKYIKRNCMPIILQNYKSVAYTHFCHSHVENGFKMNRVLIKVKVSMNLYLHIVNFEIERYITIMVPMLSIK